jgi:glucan 1,3-beta-glucosidase
MANFSILTLLVALRVFLLASAAPTTSAVAVSDAAAASTYWVASITRQGTVPYGGASGYKVFRNVMDYGAKGDGTPPLFLYSCFR